MMLRAKPGCCEEAALGVPGGGYIPCNKPAANVIGWKGRPHAPILMCEACTDHNVRNRRGQIVTPPRRPRPTCKAECPRGPRWLPPADAAAPMKPFALVGMRARAAEALVNNRPEGEYVDLVREPDNRYDRFAVQVWARGRHVGYIAATQVRPVALAMEERQKKFPLASERARLSGRLHWSQHGRDPVPLIGVQEAS